ncbi:MAG TPA: tRNA pseudouridine(38-40) synthase TruA [Clostridiales bacterium]|nr:tRNA pseudouridine(38-40) synthase TruA [Clostridiales bacterium]
MKRIKLEIAYDGTKYCGWQVQLELPTVEDEVNKALSTLLNEEIEVIGASRTDSGVHALGNVAVFDTDSRIPSDKFTLALNQRLPDDIRVQSSIEVPLNFHPRKMNCRKTYQYRILNRRIALPTERYFSHFVYYPLSLELMEKAGSYLIGEHDFKSFCSVKTQATDTVRTIYDLRVTKEDKDTDIIAITIEGNGFLYNMIRIIAGTLIEVGRGALSADDIPNMLKGLDRSLAGPTAPPEGLNLMKIDYGNK